MSQLYFSCPVCGEDVPRKAKACPGCGACEKSGWSEDQYLDGLDLPDEDDLSGRYLNSRAKRNPSHGGLSRVWVIAAALLFLTMLLSMLRVVW